MIGHIRVRRLPHGVGLPVWQYKSEGAAGLDLAAAQDGCLFPGRWDLIPTGFEIELPLGFEGQVRPRSGLSRDRGVTVLNSPGTIDSDYRGEVKVLLINHGRLPWNYVRGDRIAQLVMSPVILAHVIEMDELSETFRGAAGFGSTGA